MPLARSESSSVSLLWLGRVLLLALVYIGLGALGLLIPGVSSGISMFWLPTGVAVVALLRWGSTCWPGVFTGSMVITLLLGASWLTAVPAAISGTLGPWLTAWLLRRWRFNAAFTHRRDLAMMLGATAIGMLVSSASGALLLTYTGVVEVGRLFVHWQVWWLGDMLGVLTVSPLLLSLSIAGLKPFRKRWGEFCLWTLGAVGIGLLVFPVHGLGLESSLPLAFLPMPFAVWAALRFGLAGASLSIIWFAGLAAWSTSHGVGPFSLSAPLKGQLMLAAFTASLSSLALLVVSVHGRILKSESALREGVRHYHMLFRTNPHPMWVYDLETLEFLEVNDAAIALYGYSREQFLEMSIHDLFRPEDVPALARMMESMSDGLNASGIWRHVIRNGSEISVEISSHGFPFRGRRARMVLAYDVTERVESEVRLRRSEQLLREAQYVAQLGSWEMVLGSGQDQLICTDEVYSIYEFEPQSIPTVPDAFLKRIHPDDRILMARAYRALRSGEPDSNFEFRLLFPDGRVKWLYARCTSYGEAGAGPKRLVGTIQDVSARKQTEQQIHDLAFYDLLTGLPNRRLLIDRLHQVLAGSSRSGKFGALLFIDLDHFKNLNDTRGHDIGDELLKAVAQRICCCIRESDTAARFGGDEFVVMLPDLDPDQTRAISQVELVGEKIRDAVSQPYYLDGEDYHGSPSIGISLFQGDQQSVDQLLKQADVAMYQAKASGRNAIRFFDPAMQAALDARASLEMELRRAIPLRQFEPYFQVQVDNCGQVQGAEVLARWMHPQQGMISPAQFIPLAEENGLIVAIGQLILEAACEQLKLWQADEQMRDLQLAVNVSARQFRQPNFVDQVEQALRQSGTDPSKLKLELTESLVLDNVDDTIAKMNALKKIGVGFSMDDFGTGQSSLAYLKRLPLDQLKIDQSFVRDIVSDPNDAVIVQTIIVMARSLGLNVIAEGVETGHQLQFLQSNGCEAFQGYLFSRPLPLAEFEQIMRSRPWSDSVNSCLFLASSGQA